MKNNIAIVVITYNRLNCLQRLITRLQECVYTQKVDLIISIDHSNSTEIEGYAKNVLWEYGNLIVKTYNHNLGLRKHVLKCGSYSEEYDAIVVFEDDIYPSKYFFDYCIHSVDFYKNDSRIAGISLYQHRWNTNCNYSFDIDINPNYDNFFMQFAQSWGQIWTKEQWNAFYSWYLENNEEFDKKPHIPDSVTNFPKSSWLKYYIKYCIEMNKFFVYPNIALATNFSDAGTHNKSSSCHYQIPILNYQKSNYTFNKLDENAVIYDAFHERLFLGQYLNVDDKQLCVDYYGTKNNRENKRYWLTLKKEDYKILKSYSLSLKPYELNIINNINGHDIFLYDTKQNEKNKFNLHYSEDVKRLFYSNRDIKIFQLYKMSIYITLDKLKVIIHKLKQRIFK